MELFITCWDPRLVGQFLLRELTLLSLPPILHVEEKPINSKSHFRSYHEVDDDEKRERKAVRDGRTNNSC